MMQKIKSLIDRFPLAVVILGYFLFVTFTASAATSVVINQKGKKFSEKKITVAVGDIIIFNNNDKVGHNILVKETKYSSGLQKPGKKIKIAFKDPGKYSVRCGIHPRMKLKVTAK